MNGGAERGASRLFRRRVEECVEEPTQVQHKFRFSSRSVGRRARRSDLPRRGLSPSWRDADSAPGCGVRRGHIGARAIPRRTHIFTFARDVLRDDDGASRRRVRGGAAREDSPRSRLRDAGRRWGGGGDASSRGTGAVHPNVSIRRASGASPLAPLPLPALGVSPSDPRARRSTRRASASLGQNLSPRVPRPTIRPPVPRPARPAFPSP